MVQSMAAPRGAATDSDQETSRVPVPPSPAIATGAERGAATAGEAEREILDQIEVLRRAAPRLTRHYQDAEDLLQETCLRAFRSIHQFAPGTNARAWLLRIMVNLHRDGQRSAASRPRFVSLDGERPDGLPSLVERLPSGA